MEGMEKKGLRVNTGKTECMWCRLSLGQAEDSGESACVSLDITLS